MAYFDRPTYVYTIWHSDPPCWHLAEEVSRTAKTVTLRYIGNTDAGVDRTDSHTWRAKIDGTYATGETMVTWGGKMRRSAVQLTQAAAEALLERVTAERRKREAQEELERKQRQRSCPDLVLLGLVTMPKDRAALDAAYRQAAKGAHPDGGGSHAAFIALHEAYDKLSSCI